MTHTTPENTQANANEQQHLIGTLIAGLFGLLGIGTIIAFGMTVFNDPVIRAAINDNYLTLAFLDTYGLILPILALSLGITFIYFAWQLFQRDLITSGWASLTLFWGMVFSIIVIFIMVFNVVFTNLGLEPDKQIGLDYGIIAALVVLGAVLGAAWWWMQGNRIAVYTRGEETIASRESLTAWNLLIPTVAILILVAARPLEQTFIASLTNRTFAGGEDQVAQFVGLQNYMDLLGFRLDTVDCIRDETATCTTQTINAEYEEAEALTVDLDSIPALEPATLDVSLEFFNTETLNRLLSEQASFAAALRMAAEAMLTEAGTAFDTVEVVSIGDSNTVTVTVDGTEQELVIADRLTALDGLNLSDIDLNYAEDVRLEGLNTYRIRSRTLREELTNLVESQYDLANDDSLDDISIDGFSSLDQIDVTVTRLESSQEVVYEDVRDVVGEAYRNFQAINTFDLFGNHYVFSARDANFFVALGNTLFFTFFTVIAELILGMIIAMVVNSNFVGRGFMRAAMLIPWAIPTVVSAKLWEYMLIDNRTGLINDLLIRLGIIDQSVAWLADTNTQIWSLIFVDVWKTTPFMALLLLAGLQTIPSDVYEAADVDGAGKIRQFFSITLPLLRPTIAVALVFRTLDAIRAFDVFQVLLGRQLQSVATYNQFVLVENREFGYASAIGVTIFIIILIFTVIYVRALGVDTD